MADVRIAIAGNPEAASADFVCDGTNDEIEIQLAIDATGPGGGTVFFGAGNYSVSKAIAVLSDSVSLQGDPVGAPSSHLLPTGFRWFIPTEPQ